MRAEHSVADCTALTPNPSPGVPGEGGRTNPFPRGIMGVMTFQLPRSLAEETLRQELHHASVAGGQDNMPYPTEATVEGGILSLGARRQRER